MESFRTAAAAELMGEGDEDDAVGARVLYRLKRILSAMGFQSDALRRECLANMTKRADWGIKLCKVLFEFISVPTVTSYLVF